MVCCQWCAFCPRHTERRLEWLEHARSARASRSASDRKSENALASPLRTRPSGPHRDRHDARRGQGHRRLAEHRLAGPERSTDRGADRPRDPRASRGGGASPGLPAQPAGAWPARRAHDASRRDRPRDHRPVLRRCRRGRLNEAGRRGYNVVLGTAHARADEAIALWAILEARHCDAIVLLGDMRDQPRVIEDLRNVRRSQLSRCGRDRGRPASRRSASTTTSASTLSWTTCSAWAIDGSRLSAADDWATSPSAKKRSSTRCRGSGSHCARATCDRREQSGGSGGESCARCSASREPPTAVVFATDVLAIGGLHEAYKHGLHVPDRSVDHGLRRHPARRLRGPGPDDRAHARSARWSRAALRWSSTTTMGRRADATSHPVLQPSLVVRDSTDCTGGLTSVAKYAVGIDFGTESGRAVLVDVADGRELATAVYRYANGVIDEHLPQPGRGRPPGAGLGATGSGRLHQDVPATRAPAADRDTGVDPADVIGIGIDFTACTMLPTTADGTPLCMIGDYRRRPHAWVKLWKHHAAQPEADRINDARATLAARRGCRATAARSRRSGSTRRASRSSTKIPISIAPPTG